METQLFLWTGKIIWWVICCSAVACVVGGGILAPIIVRQRIINHLWHWILTVELARYGVSVEDMEMIRAIPDATREEAEAFDKLANRLHARHKRLKYGKHDNA